MLTIRMEFNLGNYTVSGQNFRAEASFLCVSKAELSAMLHTDRIPKADIQYFKPSAGDFLPTY